MSKQPSKPRGSFSDAARAAAQAAKALKRAGSDRFGMPELFIVKAGDQAFTWELRRFGGVLLQRGSDPFASKAGAEAAGNTALAEMLRSPDLPTFERQIPLKLPDAR